MAASAAVLMMWPSSSWSKMRGTKARMPWTTLKRLVRRIQSQVSNGVSQTRRSFKEKFQGVMTRIANRAFEMSSKSTGHGAIQVPDIPRFKRCAYPKSGGTGGIIRDSRLDPLPTALRRRAGRDRSEPRTAAGNPSLRPAALSCALPYLTPSAMHAWCMHGDEDHQHRHGGVQNSPP